MRICATWHHHHGEDLYQGLDLRDLVDRSITLVMLFQISGKPLWWIIGLFIPVLNILVSLLAYLGTAEVGNGTVFSLGLFFLPMIFYPNLTFGDVEYCG